MQVFTTERRNNYSTNNCDLIREYLARTRAPPPMFRPTTSFMAFNQIPPHRMLVDIAYKHPQLLIDDEEVAAGDDADELDADTMSKVGCRQSEASNNRLNKECKLIGNVNPALVKTWEQLNGFRSDDNASPLANYPMHYASGNGGRDANETASNKSFVIRRAAAASDHFYDSIDNESYITQEDEEHLIASICDEMEAGGEALAEYISMIE